MKYSIHIKQSLSYFLLLGLVACSSPNETGDATVADDPSETTADHTYRLTATQFQAAGMQLAQLASHDFHQTIKTNGLIDVPPSNRALVSAYFGGFVKDIALLPGEVVRKGQVLFVLENPDYIEMQQEFLEAKGQLSYLKSDFERQANLVEDNVTSQKNYLKAEADYTVTRVRYESLKQKLSLMNINTDNLTEQQLRTTIAVTAPIGGYVTNVNIAKGQFLNPTDVAIAITNPDHLHLELLLFEKDLASVAIGQPVTFNVQNDTQREYAASVHLINRSIDPEKRTASIHCHLADEKNTQQFSPGMYVEAEIYTHSAPALALPASAIVNIENQYFVLVKQTATPDAFTFIRRQVTVGTTTDGFTQILNPTDFPQDAEFLGKGAFDLLAE
ncbi:MAG: efflux RND transporter periplasmic adaptor subunit [Bacteroidetes bacterium]|nr:MAG: efflux RND transporter periplasmic adaptor subunit [Bacteroidota bacterium]PTM14032.1 MAG: efflux RND transporter periplasmic adaptor subunit [Bacteroidota bacterium]